MSFISSFICFKHQRNYNPFMFIKQSSSICTTFTVIISCYWAIMCFFYIHQFHTFLTFHFYSHIISDSESHYIYIYLLKSLTDYIPFRCPIYPQNITRLWVKNISDISLFEHRIIPFFKKPLSSKTYRIIHLFRKPYYPLFWTAYMVFLETHIWYYPVIIIPSVMDLPY